MDNRHIITIFSVHGLINAERHLEDFDPIPLTEDWLLAFGFKRDVYDDEVSWLGPAIERHNPYTKSYVLLKRNVLSDQFYFHGVPIIIVKSVHQLQNLYFALTETELTYERVTAASQG